MFRSIREAEKEQEAKAPKEAEAKKEEAANLKRAASFVYTPRAKMTTATHPCRAW